MWSAAACQSLFLLHGYGCMQITFGSRLCCRRQGLNLNDCYKLTDASFMAVGHGCGRMQRILVSYWFQMVDASVSLLGHGCAVCCRVFISKAVVR